MLEYRLVYRRWPRAGDRFVIRTGRGFQKEKTHSFVHWIMDPDTGEAWCTTEAVAVARSAKYGDALRAEMGVLAALHLADTDQRAEAATAVRRTVSASATNTG